MKLNEKCPKCQSQAIIRLAGNKYNTHFKISLDKWGTKFANFERFICMGCGFSEEWVKLDQKFMDWADKNWDTISVHNVVR